MKGWKQAYVSWREDGNFPYRASQLMLEGLLDSDHATTEAEEAGYLILDTCYLLLAICYLLPATCYPLPTTHYPPPTT
jgi:hypothetical protein